MTKSVAFYTLGCKLNFSETSAIGRQLAEHGFSRKEFQQGADVYVINTCSVTDHADRKCRKVVKEALKHNANAFVVIIGCYAQLKPQEISMIPGVDLVLGAGEKFNLMAHLTDLAKTEKARIFNSPIKETNIFVPAFSIGDRTRTFLKVQDGCEYFCAFCTIPLARGKSRSDTISNVVKTANEAAAMGVKEIVLTGVNIGDFGRNTGEDFLQLAQAMEKVEGIERIRISSIEPNLLNNSIIRFVAGSRRFVPHFHLPLQSGSNKILKLMRRKYLRELYAERVSYIRELMPHCCIGVDVITGFPGETEEEFMETYAFIRDLDVSYLHVFPYSERPNTLAGKMREVVPVKARQSRAEMLRILSAKKRRQFYEQHVGQTRMVLLEADSDNGVMHGFTDNYIKVRTTYDPLLVNELVKAELLAVNEDETMEVSFPVFEQSR